METVPSSTSGVASIKAEFLMQDHVRKLDLNFVATKDKKRMSSDAHSKDTNGPPKKKLKGQNKHRPRNQKTPRAEKLCFKVGTDGSCPYGSSCCYSHDVTAYIANKPPDIGLTCYLYRTFGKCPYTFSCRFASDHVRNSENQVLDEIWDIYKDRKMYKNILSKDLQKSLRRRDYNFKKSNELMKNFTATTKNKCNKQDLPSSSSPVPNKNIALEDQNENIVIESEGKNENVIQSVAGNENIIIKDKAENQNIVMDGNVNGNIINYDKGQNIKHDGQNPEVTQAEGRNKSIDEKTEQGVVFDGSHSVKSDDQIRATFSDEKVDYLSSIGTSINLDKEINKCSQMLDNKEISVSDLSAIVSRESNENTKNHEDILFETEVKQVDFANKLYLAPLTTVGNLPFRRICKELGADITCSEMSMALSLLQGQPSEWALLKRHHTEDIFGIQLCGSHPDVMTRCCQLLSETASFDFIDLNLGCPLDAIYKKGAGCGLMNRLKKLEGIVYGVSSVINVPLTLKMRTGIYGNENITHSIIEKIKQWNNSVYLITVHGRSREQRYTRSADWNYISQCNRIADPIPLFGNGDILSYEDYNMRCAETKVSGCMIARGALIKPWIFKEIKDQTHWDISSAERLEILKKYSNYGLEHWGSDTEGVEKTRRFMLEWLSFLYRYIPVGILEQPPQRINERPPQYIGRNDLETLMASPSCSDWVKISEMLLGPVPEHFIFLPKHKANAYK